jgi:tetratricopeptide (TPR) repeat protein
MHSFKQARLKSLIVQALSTENYGIKGGSDLNSSFKWNATNRGAITALLGSVILALTAFSGVAQPQSRPSGARPKTTVTPTAKVSAGDEIDQLLAAGQDAHQSGRYEEAIAAFNRVLALLKNQPRTAAVANFLIGNVNMTQRKFGNAEIAYQKSIALNPSHAGAYNNLGEALGELKQFPRAIQAFTKAIALDPTLLKARYNQAVTYDRMRNFRYSEFVFRNLIKSYPKYSLGYDGLAVTLSKAGRAKEAMAFHEKAIALTPDEPSFYFNYAISNLMIGNTAKAMEQQEKLKTLDPVIAERLASVIVKQQL